MSEKKTTPPGVEVYDLRSAIELLKTYDDEYIETNEPR